MARTVQQVALTIELYLEPEESLAQLQDDIMTDLEKAGYEVVATEVMRIASRRVPDKDGNGSTAGLPAQKEG